jgi:hypothetical protein
MIMDVLWTTVCMIHVIAAIIAANVRVSRLVACVCQMSPAITAMIAVSAAARIDMNRRHDRGDHRLTAAIVAMTTSIPARSSAVDVDDNWKSPG